MHCNTRISVHAVAGRLNHASERMTRPNDVLTRD